MDHLETSTPEDSRVHELPAAVAGSPSFPEVAGSLPPSSREAIDAAVETLAARRGAWVAIPVPERIRILDELIAKFARLADDWVCSCLGAKGLEEDPASAAEEWVTGPYPLLRNLRLLRQALTDIAESGLPRIPGPITTRPDGQVIARVYPQDLYDRVLFPGVTIDVWMQPDVRAEEVAQTQAWVYQHKDRAGRVALVLAAGNASCIGPMDALYKLFVEDQVVIYKSHPVNACLGPLIETGFAPLVEQGFLRVVHGGSAEGAYLSQHPQVDELHMTGSDKTFEAIVFGGGPEGTRRKAERSPLLHKRFTAELGNVTPVIVVPGPWSASDLAYQAQNLATMLTLNAGFFCATPRVLIQHAGWPLREALLDALGRVLGRTPARKAYYPGAEARYGAFTSAYDETLSWGATGEGHLPWTLMPGVDPEAAGQVGFTTEAFCPVAVETALPARSVPEFVDQAVELANDRLWGTLAATILVHPGSLKDPAIAAAVERAIANLRYGTVSINHWSLVSYALVTPPWGAFPGHDIYDVQSGIGVVHNTLMFDRPQKSVLRAPFRTWPLPPWFVTARRRNETLSRMVAFEAAPSPSRLAAVAWQALRS